MPRLGKDISFTGAARFVQANTITTYGSFDFTNAGSPTTSSNYQWSFESQARNGTQTFTRSGKTLNITMEIRVVGATFQLQDDLTSSSTILLYNGTFDANDNDVTALYFWSSNSNTRSVLMGTGTWTLTGLYSSISSWYIVTTTGLTFNAETSTIVFSYVGASENQIYLAGQTFHNITFAGGNASVAMIYGSNIINDLIINAPKTVRFQTGTTQTINGTFTANGVAQPTKIINGATLNGGFETAGVAPQPFANWTQQVGGTGTVTDETTTVHAGSHAARFDGGNSFAQLYQLGLSTTKRYKATFYARGASGGEAILVGGNAAPVSKTVTNSYAQYTVYFTPDNTAVKIQKNGAGVVYVDDFTLEESNDVEIISSSTTPATLSKASGTTVVNYAYVKYVNATGGTSKWYPALTSVVQNSSGWSTDTTPPTDPTTITATVDATPIVDSSWINADGNIDIAFSGAADPDSGLLGYYTYFGTNASADPSVWQAQAADPQAYATSISEADDGKHFYFRIKTKDAVGNVGAAVTLFDFGYDITNPTRPSFVAADPPGYTTTNSFDFAWPAGTDPVGGAGASGIQYYQYKRATDGAWTATADANDREATGILAYQEGANVFYVRTVDNAGNASSTYNQVTYYWSGVAPAAPTNLDVTPDPSDTNDLTISWDKSVTVPGDPPTVGYYYSINAAPTLANVTYVASEAATVSIGPDAYATVQGENTVYVLGVNAAGNYSFEEAYVASTTFNCQTAAPPAPVSVTISDSSNRAYDTYSLTIVWSAGVGQDEDAFDHYIIERATDGVTFATLATTTNSTAYIDASGLDTAVTYYYRVKSVDNAGKSSAASTIVSKQPIGNYQTPPDILSTPTVGSITSQGATISWTTDRVSSSIVRYGTVSGTWVGSSGQYDSLQDHSVILNGLNPDATYYYQVQSLDEFYDYDAADAYSSTYNFSTSEAPAISAAKVSNITLTSADISFETTTVATTTLYYGLDKTYGSSIEDISGAGKTSHTVKLAELAAGTTYHFQISGLDDQGFPLVSDDYQFDTLALPKVENLQISALTGRAASAMKVQWTTNVMTTTVLRYRPLGTASWKETTDTESKLAHEVEINDLADSTVYEVIAAGRDALGNLAESETRQFATPKDSRAPQISDIAIETFLTGTGTNLKAQISIGWKTDEPATAQVDYGKGTDGAYTQSTTEETGLATQRSVIISDLDSAMPYHLKIMVKDEAGNLTESDAQVFVTGEGKKSAWDLVKDVLFNVFGFWMKRYQ
jgi:hypothetical protein